MCTLGELIGFGGLPVLGAAIFLLLSAGMDSTNQAILLYAVAVLGGLGEGTVLALFQLRVLIRTLPGLNPRHWIFATAVAAAIAWAVGMLAPTLDEVIGISPGIQIAIWIPASLLILLSIGVAQAWVIRRLVNNPVSWVIGNSLAWLAGLPWTFALPALLPDGAPIAWWVTTFVVAGILMGLSVGLVTGVFLMRLRVIQQVSN